MQLLNDRQKELENNRVALATTKSQYEQAKDGLQRAKETEVSAVIHDYAMKFSDVFVALSEIFATSLLCSISQKQVMVIYGVSVILGRNITSESPTSLT